MKMLAAFLWLGLSNVALADIDDDRPKIMQRLFPKTGTLEVSAGAGYLLNPSFVDTALVEMAARYAFTERWGVGLSLDLARTKDRYERRCVETFYNDPKHEVAAECMEDDDGEGLRGAKEANVGPAYAPIRELRQIVTLHGDYSMAYGKMIFLHGATGHFDLRVRFGGGLTTSDYYREQTEDRTTGVSPSESDRYGPSGRPASERQTTPHVYLAIAEDLLFLKRFSFGGEVASYALLGTPQGFEYFMVLKVLGGIRF